jgi:hypothetical protein
MPRRALVLATATILTVAAAHAHAIDHGNLDENRPLRLEDAYPIAHGEIAIEAGAGVTTERRGRTRGVFPIEILYGALPNFHVGLGTTLLTDLHDIEDEPRLGNLTLSGLYNFNQETLSLPALALKLDVTLPTGIDSKGVDVGLKGIVTRSVGRLGFHLNGGYRFLNGTTGDERRGRYELALGATYPIWAPLHTRTTLIADVFTTQSAKRHGSNVVGAEVGVRYQLTPQVVWDAGAGTEFAGPAERARFFFTTGFSFGF